MITSIGSVSQGPNKLWSVSFDTFMGHPGHFDRPSSTVTSAPLFETQDEAYAAGSRALDVLEATEMFPNLTEKF